MFFATQLKSVTSNGAVDVQGRSLSFIGYLQVKAGDTVYTDGKFIFGNVPPKGAPAIFNEPSGVPVLGDSYFLGEQDDDLRGYFTGTGKYKSYQIAGEYWIVNGKKTYAHDDSEGDIIDTEIAIDKDGSEAGTYTVEKVVIPLVKYTSQTWGDNRFSRQFNKFSTVSDYARTRSINDADEILKDCELIIKKDAVEISRLRLSTLVKEIEDENHSYVNFFEMPKHDEICKLKSRAVLQNFKITPDGKWEAAIIIQVFSFRQIKSNGIIFIDNTKENRTTYEHIPIEHSTYLNVVEQTIMTEEYYYPRGIEYRVNDIMVENSPYWTTANGIFGFKINSDGKLEKFFKQVEAEPLLLYDTNDEYTGTERKQAVNFDEELSEAINKSGFPYSYSWSSSPQEPCIGKRITSWFGNGLGTMVGEITVIQDWDYDWYHRTVTVYDSRNLPNAPDYDNPVNEIADDFNFPVQDDYHATIENVDENITKWQFGGVYSKDNEKVFDDISADNYDAHKWNMSFVQLKGGNCLFGIHDDKLYLKDNTGKVTEVGDGLKNFRLRELKKIRKAKK